MIDCNLAYVDFLKQKIIVLIDTINSSAEHGYDSSQISSLHNAIMPRYNDLKNATDSYVTCGGDPNSLPVHLSQKILEAINYTPVPEFSNSLHSAALYGVQNTDNAYTILSEGLRHLSHGLGEFSGYLANGLGKLVVHPEASGILAVGLVCGIMFSKLAGKH